MTCYFVLLGMLATQVYGSPNSGNQLRSELEAAIKSGDANVVRSLFCHVGGTNDWMESSGVRETMIQLQTRDLLKARHGEVKISPLPANFQSVQTNESNGIRRKFNVDVVGMIDFASQSGEPEHLPYGTNGTNYYIAGIILEKAAGKCLFVRVLSGPNPDSLTFKGHWVYMTGGKEVKVEISDATNRFKMCWGDYVKSCMIQRTSTNAGVAAFPNWFHFEVLEGEKTVFISPEMINEQPMVYEKQ